MEGTVQAWGQPQSHAQPYNSRRQPVGERVVDMGGTRFLLERGTPSIPTAKPVPPLIQKERKGFSSTRSRFDDVDEVRAAPPATKYNAHRILKSIETERTSDSSKGTGTFASGAPRFAKDRSHATPRTLGPGNYNIPDSMIRKSPNATCSAAMGRSIVPKATPKQLQRKHRRDNPSPSQYTIPDTWQTRSPHKSSQFASSVPRDVDFQKQRKYAGPGPGAYSPQAQQAHTSAVPSSMFSSQVSRNLPQPLGSGLAPGTFASKNPHRIACIWLWQQQTISKQPHCIRRCIITASL
eukprot:m.41799 g.41799  ORF g.41799 m.41799 type:complete len:294 (+) comp10615_c0_seq1:135-1016(+)